MLRCARQGMKIYDNRYKGHESLSNNDLPSYQRYSIS